MAFLIDSDWTIDHLNNVKEATDLLGRLGEERLFISIVTYMEVYQGALRTEDPATAISNLQAFVAQVPIMPLTTDIAERCAVLREDLRKQRKNPTRRALDLIIAATALVHDLVLVTRNVDDYKDLPDLKLYS